jgi:DNA-directed RNA polymerase specialized sigma subunit
MYDRPGLDYPCPVCNLIGVAFPFCHQAEERSVRDKAILECQSLTSTITAHQAAIISLSRRRGELIMTLNQSGMSMREIGRRLGISGVRVRQLVINQNGEDHDAPN